MYVLFGQINLAKNIFRTHTQHERDKQHASSLTERRKEVPEGQATYDGIVSKNGVHRLEDFIQDLFAKCRVLTILMMS